MKRYNFRDPDTQEEFFIQNYKIVYRLEKVVYLNKSGEELINNNGNPLEFILSEGEFNCKLGSSVAQSKLKLNKYLKARAKEHFKKDIAYEKNQMIKHSRLS